MAEKKGKERNILEDKCRELVEKNNKLSKQVSGKSSVQGSKHLILDVLIVEATKLKPYLDFILDKEIVTQEARKNVHMAKQDLKKGPWTQLIMQSIS